MAAFQFECFLSLVLVLFLLGSSSTQLLLFVILLCLAFLGGSFHSECFLLGLFLTPSSAQLSLWFWSFCRFLGLLSS